MAPSNPSDSPARRETAALRLSAGASVVLAVLGIAWGLVFNSQVILFDGVFAIIGFGLSWVGLRAAALVEAGPTPRYPFGREALAPLVVAVQALVLLGVFAYAAADAVDVILSGGGDTELGPALVYSILTLAACLGVYRVLQRRQEGSDLVAAEAMQWRASTVLGVALTIGFAVALVLVRTRWAGLAPYVDPLLVLLAAALVLPAPVRMLRQAFRELLEGVPPAAVSGPILATIAEVGQQLGLPEPTTRLGKLGRKVYIELDYLVADDAGWTVDDADRIRRLLMAALSQPGRLLWINVELHTDPAWDRA